MSISSFVYIPALKLYHLYLGGVKETIDSNCLVRYRQDDERKETIAWHVSGSG